MVFKEVVLDKDMNYKFEFNDHSSDSECLFNIKNGIECGLFLVNRNSKVSSKIVVNSGCKIRVFVMSFNSSANVHVEFRGNLAECQLFHVYIADGAETNDRIGLYFSSPGNRGRAVSRGICKNGGKSFCEGFSKIYKNAANSEVFVDLKALILDESSRAKMLPNLEIENNEVRAGHSASVIKIDDEALFYLQSRGINPEEARNILVRAFVSFPNDEANEIALEVLNNGV